jgi:hypothetical protein
LVQNFHNFLNEPRLGILRIDSEQHFSNPPRCFL